MLAATSCLICGTVAKSYNLLRVAHIVHRTLFNGRTLVEKLLFRHRYSWKSLYLSISRFVVKTETYKVPSRSSRVEQIYPSNSSKGLSSNSLSS